MSELEERQITSQTNQQLAHDMDIVAEQLALEDTQDVLVSTQGGDR